MENCHYIIINANYASKGTIVFLHEGLGCTATWGTYPQELCSAANMQGIIYDRPGYGQSDGDLTNRTNDYLIEAAHFLSTFLETFNIKNPILYGHSDGGSIALAYAGLYPQNITCLISEAAHVLNEKETIEGIEKAVLAFKAGKLEGLQKWHGPNYREVFNAWSVTWLRPTFDLKSLRNLLPNILVSQLIIQGEKDQYGSNKQVETIANETAGKTTIFSPNCGHAPFIEMPEAVMAHCIQFIKSHSHGNF